MIVFDRRFLLLALGALLPLSTAAAAESGDIRLRFRVSNLCEQRGSAIERMTRMRSETALTAIGSEIRDDTSARKGTIYARARPDGETDLDFTSLLTIVQEHHVRIDEALIEAVGTIESDDGVLTFRPNGQRGPAFTLPDGEYPDGTVFVRGSFDPAIEQESPGAVPTRARPGGGSPTRYQFELRPEVVQADPNFTLDRDYPSLRADVGPFRTVEDGTVTYTILSTVTSGGFAFRSPDGRINPTLTVEKGQDVRIRFVNRTHGTHNICVQQGDSIDCTKPVRYSRGCGVEQTRTLDITARADGTYRCTTLDHDQLGMVGTLNVTEGKQDSD